MQKTYLLLAFICLFSCSKEDIKESKGISDTFNQSESIDPLNLDYVVIRSEKLKALNDEPNSALLLSGELLDPTNNKLSDIDLHFFPSDDYKPTMTQNLHNKEFSSLKREFDGVVLVYDKGSDSVRYASFFKNGVFESKLYPKGVIINKILPMDCYEETYTITTYHYTDWKVNGTIVGSTYNGYSVESFSSIICSEGGGGGGGGGSGSGSTTIRTTQDLNSNMLVGDIWPPTVYVHCGDIVWYGATGSSLKSAVIVMKQIAFCCETVTLPMTFWRPAGWTNAYSSTVAAGIASDALNYARQQFIEEYGPIISEDDMSLMQFNMRRYITDYLSSTEYLSSIPAGFSATGNITSSSQSHEVNLRYFSGSANCL